MSSFRGFSKSDGAKAAKHASNQPTLDHLRAMAKEPRYANSAHYPQVFKRGMAALAKAAAVSLEVRDVRAFLADEGGARTSIAAAAKKRPNDGTRQTTLSEVKRPRVQTPAAAEGAAIS